MLNIGIWRRIIATPYGLTLSLCIAALGVLLSGASPLTPIAISEGANLDKGGVTLFYLINAVVAISLTLSSGYLSDGTISRYKLVAGAGVLASFGYFGIALARTPFQAYLSGIVMTFIAVLFPQLFAISREGILRTWDARSQTLGVTCLRTMFSLGFIFGTSITSALTRFLPVHTIFFILGTAAIILTGFSTYIIRRASNTYQTASTETEQTPPDRQPVNRPTFGLRITERMLLRNVRQTLATGDKGTSPTQPAKAEVPQTTQDGAGFNWTTFGLLVLALIFLRGSDSARGVYLPLVMKGMFQDIGIAPLMIGITAAAELITMSVVGMIAQYIGERMTLIIGALLGVFYFVMLAVSQSLPVLFAVQLVYAFYVAALLGVGMAYMQNMIAHRAGLSSSVFMSSMQIGSIVGILSPNLIKGISQNIFYAPATLCLIGALVLSLSYLFEHTLRVRTMRLSQR